MNVLPTPTSIDGALGWVRQHLAHLSLEQDATEITASSAFIGGQTAADAALERFNVAGYAARRNEVWPESRRGASRLSPWIRHGFITLQQAWDHVGNGPARDVEKFRDELAWQEYARHVYARVGSALAEPLRYQAPVSATGQDPWPREMACMDLTLTELHRDGWLVNQTRMWLASQWTVRHGADWRAGEQLFWAHLLDGSRAANRLGWQWTVGTGNGRPYGFSRQQVVKRAPGVCSSCALQRCCPIESWPSSDPTPSVVDQHPGLRADQNPARTAGPGAVNSPTGEAPQTVWMTMESLGDDDPALVANPGLPVHVVFDGPLLSRLHPSGKRLVFFAQSLADLAQRREVVVCLGDPVSELAGLPLAATFTPVPGWRRRSAGLDLVQIHPWPWLARPHPGPVTSFSAWRAKARFPSR